MMVRSVSPTEYYDDYRWFQFYESSDFETTEPAIVKPEFIYNRISDLYSWGNIYDFFPLGNNVVEFWTHEYNEETYCITLQRYGFLYTLRIFKMKNNEVTLVMKSLYLDEVMEIESRLYTDS